MQIHTKIVTHEGNLVSNPWFCTTYELKLFAVVRSPSQTNVFCELIQIRIPSKVKWSQEDISFALLQGPKLPNSNLLILYAWTHMDRDLTLIFFMGLREKLFLIHFLSHSGIKTGQRRIVGMYATPRIVIRDGDSRHIPQKYWNRGSTFHGKDQKSYASIVQQINM